MFRKTRGIRAGLLAAAVATTPGIVLAQQTTGRIVGHVVDPTTKQPVAGVTVVAQGPQGDEIAMTDDAGDYVFDGLPIGRYVVRFYTGDTTPRAERPVVVTAERTVRANVDVNAGEIKTETITLVERPPAVDVGGARTGLTLDPGFLRNVPLGRTVNDTLQLAPGAFVDGTGGVSIGGASGLENTYFVDGLNVTGLEYGDVMNQRGRSSGGTNLVLDFVDQITVDTGGYTAEHGGAMGGVVNVVTKSGSNEWKGSAFGMWSPYWLSGTPKEIASATTTLVGRERPDYDTSAGFEVGGPLVKNRLFLWAGFAPRFEKSHVYRDVMGRLDANGDGMADVGADGQPATRLLARTRIDQERKTYQYGAKITFVPAPDHRLNLSLFGTPTSTKHADNRGTGGNAAANDPKWALQGIDKTNTDALAQWTSHLFDRRWKIDATAGLHHEKYDEKSPTAALNALNQQEHHGASLYDFEQVPGCEPRMTPGGSFDPCPVDNYHNGGYGLLKAYTGKRWMGDLKSTHVFSLLGRHEVKYGAHLELNDFDQTRTISGPPGSRAFAQHYPGNSLVWSAFSLPKGRYPFQFADGAPGDLDPNKDGSPAELAGAPFYKDALKAHVKNVTSAYFVQDSYSIRPNLLLNFGARLERQKLFDSQNEEFASLDNLGFRAGFVYDPSNQGRSKVYGHYGRFFETVPLNLAARYFGGEGILIRQHDNSMCKTPTSQWKGTGGEWNGCPLQPQNPPASSPYATFNNGSNYPVQPHLRGQYHDEIVAGLQHEVWQGLVLGVNFTHRWLGSVIEDGTAADGTFVLANPGNVPDKAIDQAARDVQRKEMEVASAAGADKSAREAELGQLKSRLDNLKGLKEQPKPERTYTAITLSGTQRLAQRWTLNASYTYSRLVGNYNGLFDADNQYMAPNGGNAYDTPDLVLNKKGPLANDRPHSGRVSGFYELPIGGKGSLVTGLVFSAFSGVPRNYQAALIPGQQLVFLLPRGAAGRTPTVTQLDAKVAWRQQLHKHYSLELFVDVFNVINSRTALRMDDDYTYDQAAAIVNGSKSDLAHAKNAQGTPLTPNPNFGNPTAFQMPIHGRIGARLLF